MNVKDIIPLLIEHQLNIEEFFALYLFFYRTEVDNELGKEITHTLKDAVGYEHSDGVIRTVREGVLPSLSEKGWLNATTKGDKLLYTPGPKFREFFVAPWEAGDEFYDAYPSFGSIQGANIPLKTGKRIEIYYTYWKYINGSKDEHKKVLLDLEYGVQHKLICMNVAKFIDAMYWREIRKMRLNDKHIEPVKIKSFHDQDF